jgi:hypothetical protein
VEAIVLIIEALPQTAHLATYTPSRSDVLTQLYVEVESGSVETVVDDRHSTYTGTYEDVVTPFLGIVVLSLLRVH